MITPRQVASLKGVRGAVRTRGQAVKATAQANFAAHNRPGGHQVGGRSTGLNYEVYLEGPAPGAVEFGHFTPSGAKWVEGIHVLGKASR